MRSKDVEPEHLYTRAQLSEIFGGSAVGGISVSTTTATILLFPDPGSSKNWNFDTVDGGDELGPLVLYTGQGTSGNQPLSRGNAAVLNHVKDGRELRLFLQAGTIPGTNTKAYSQLGEYEVDQTDPYFVRPAPDITGTERNVIVFRLRPLGDSAVPSDDFKALAPPGLVPPNSRRESVFHSSSEQIVTQVVDMVVPLTFDLATREVEVVRRVDGLEAMKREARLVAEYQEYLHRRGHATTRLILPIPGSSSILLTDLYDATVNIAYQVKANPDRIDIRTAIGELLDLARAMRSRPAYLAILVPHCPRADLVALTQSIGISIVYPDGIGFEGIPGSEPDRL